LYVAAVLALVNMAYIAKKLPEPKRIVKAGTASGPPASLGNRISLMVRAARGPLGFLYGLTFLVTFAFANLEGTFAVYLKQHFGYGAQSSIAVAGWVFAYIGVLIVVVQGGAIRPLVKRYGEANLVVVGVGLMALGFLLFPLCPWLAVLMLGPMVPLSIGNGLNAPALRALVSRKTQATGQGASLGLSASFDSLARATGPATAGILYHRLGQTSPYWFAGALMSVAFLFALAKKRDMAATEEAFPPA
nr:MFS transporter [Armatimonadota bacterium]